MTEQEKKMVRSGIEFLWELRTYMDDNNMSVQSIAWIDESIANIEILGLGDDPDSDYSHEVYDKLHIGKLKTWTFNECMNEVKTRLDNAWPFQTTD